MNKDNLGTRTEHVNNALQGPLNDEMTKITNHVQRVSMYNTPACDSHRLLLHWNVYFNEKLREYVTLSFEDIVFDEFNADKLVNTVRFSSEFRTLETALKNCTLWREMEENILKDHDDDLEAAASVLMMLRHRKTN